MKLKGYLDKGYNLLKDNCEEPYKECQWLLMHVSGLKSIDFIINKDKEIKKDIGEAFYQVLEERLSGKPIQYILGHQEFMGLDFIVTPDVLIPRQDTEILVEYIVKKYEGVKNLRILEIGVGSGAICVSLAKLLDAPKICGLDISKKALDVARKNAELNHVLDQITFIESNLFDGLTDISKFDIIVSNPPYIPSEDVLLLENQVKDFEPSIALDGGTDGLNFYRKISCIGEDYLVSQGLLAFEIGYNQGEDVANLMKEAYSNIQVIKDLQNHQRVVIGYRK